MTVFQHPYNFSHAHAAQGPGGDGSFLDTFGEEMEALPTCENDEDYLLLRSNLRIPADANGPLSGYMMDDEGGMGEDYDSEDDSMDDSEE